MATDTDLTTHTDAPAPFPPGVPDGCDTNVWTLSYGLGLVALAYLFTYLNGRWTAFAASRGADVGLGKQGADVVLDPRTQAVLDGVTGALRAVADGARVDSAVRDLVRGLHKAGVHNGTESLAPVVSALLDGAPESVTSIARKLFPDGVTIGDRVVDPVELAATLITVAKHEGALVPEYADVLDTEDSP